MYDNITNEWLYIHRMASIVEKVAILENHSWEEISIKHINNLYWRKHFSNWLKWKLNMIVWINKLELFAGKKDYIPETARARKWVYIHVVVRWWKGEDERDRDEEKYFITIYDAQTIVSSYDIYTKDVSK